MAETATERSERRRVHHERMGNPNYAFGAARTCITLLLDADWPEDRKAQMREDLEVALDSIGDALRGSYRTPPPEEPEDPRIAAAEYERDHPMDDPGEADQAALREFGP